MRSFLSPWSEGDGKEDARGEKPVIGGTLSDGHLSYYFGFGPASVPDVSVEAFKWPDPPRYAPARRFWVRSLALGNHLREDSARLVGAKLVLKQLREACRLGHLPPVSWVARERFRTIARKLGNAGFLGKNWPRRSAAMIVQRARALLASADSPEVVFVDPEILSQVDSDEVGELVKLGDQLVGSGLGRTPIDKLGIPGPDLKENPGGWFSDAYSDVGKVVRVRALYRAVVETYRELCETYFAELKTVFLYAQLPARPIVGIRDATRYGPADLQVYWEIVPAWAEATAPRVRLGTVPTDNDRLADQMRADCVRLGRPWVGFTISYGRSNWAPWDDAVTEEVKSLLESDLRRVEEWLGGAT